MQGDSSGQQQLPARTPASRPRGRHRKPPPPPAQQHAPPLVLAAPGRDTGGDGTARAVVRLVEQECPNVAVRVGYLGSLGEDSLPAVLGDLAGMGTGPSAVVVPLLTGPHGVHDEAIRSTVAASPTQTVVTPALGPHPMLAEALHNRLAEVGLARAQHVRILSVVIAADGVVVAVPGGADAVRAADVTGVLLASRLAVPVKAAALPESQGQVPGGSSVTDVVARMREAGAKRVALAPYVIGPEVADGEIATWASLLDVECAPALGAHENVARLVVAQYTAAARHC